MLSLLYSYITDPYATIKRDFAPVDVAVVAVFFAAIGTAVQRPIGAEWLGMSPFFMVAVYFLGMGVVWAVQSALIEFIAQWFGHSTPRLVLFAWLGLAQLPMALLVPLTAVGTTMPTMAPIVGLLSGCARILWLVLQVMTIKKLYSVTWVRAGLLYIAPVLSLMTVAVVFVLLVGVFGW
ncbi:hypothetical protein EBR57_04285 [bacterium]|nr:hypothetical protein [bacterium]